MAGRLARDAPHLDGSEPIAVWFDVAWATYADLIASLDQRHLSAIEDAWEEVAFAPEKQTMETWGASETAQQGQASLMAMLGGMPPGMGDSTADAPDPAGDQS